VGVAFSHFAQSGVATLLTCLCHVVMGSKINCINFQGKGQRFEEQYLKQIIVETKL
jgi:hypothetical protein